MYTKNAHIHFVGIGGIGMSGIAKILRHQGYIISGCDNDIKKKSIAELEAIGCHIFAGNNTIHCRDVSIDILVYSSAIHAQNTEIVAAQKRGIPTIRRALMLAELMRTKYSIAIAGSHGKTTTTSLISHILIESNVDPTVIIGGHLINISTNARFGNGDFLVAEADESDRSFLHLQATLALVTNIDLEHLETYRNIDDVKQTYIRFLNNLPFYGKAFVCIDDPIVQSILPLPHIKVIKYGLSDEAELSAINVSLQPSHSTFDLTKNGTTVGTVMLKMPGEHNMQNCLGAIAVCLDIGVPLNAIIKALKTFQGIERRFWYRGTYQGAEVFDDYAHHPKEIFHTLNIAQKRAQKKLTVIFQPHRYSRTYHLWSDFISVFAQADIDHLIVTDIYPAREKPINDITSERFVHALKEQKPDCILSYVPYDEQFIQLKKALAHTKKDDLILLLGAGKLTHFAQNLTC